MAHVGEELRLVLACLGELAALVLYFIEQSHVFDGDGRLVGERLDQFDLLVGEKCQLGPSDGVLSRSSRTAAREKQPFRSRRQVCASSTVTLKTAR